MAPARKKKPAKTTDPLADTGPGGDPMMTQDGTPPPADNMPPGMEMMAGMGPAAPMMGGGPMMAPPQFASTDPGMMLAAMSKLMDADHQMLSMQQMNALQQVGPLAAQAIARASGMAESVDVPGGPAGMTQ